MSVIDGSRGATALVGLPGFVVGAQELVDDEWWLFIETDADVVGCPDCGVRAVGHGRRLTAVRDLPVAGHPVVLVWAKRRWRCGDPDCATRTWLETSPEIAARASLSRRSLTRIPIPAAIRIPRIWRGSILPSYCPGYWRKAITSASQMTILPGRLRNPHCSRFVCTRTSMTFRKYCCSVVAKPPGMKPSPAGWVCSKSTSSSGTMIGSWCISVSGMISNRKKITCLPVNPVPPC